MTRSPWLDGSTSMILHAILTSCHILIILRVMPFLLSLLYLLLQFISNLGYYLAFDIKFWHCIWFDVTLMMFNFTWLMMIVDIGCPGLFGIGWEKLWNIYWILEVLFTIFFIDNKKGEKKDYKGELHRKFSKLLNLKFSCFDINDNVIFAQMLK